MLLVTAREWNLSQGELKAQSPTAYVRTTRNPMPPNRGTILCMRVSSIASLDSLSFLTKSSFFISQTVAISATDFPLPVFLLALAALTPSGLLSTSTKPSLVEVWEFISTFFLFETPPAVGVVLERIGSRRTGTEANRCGLSFGGGSGDQTTPEATTSPREIKRSPTPVKERRRRVGFRFEEMDLEIKGSSSPSPSPSSF
ncbi:hypothetical protein DY000_02024644 [Brassica cretica]|uniref:Uncharacterized protein n=1 Tax=Brassica cretica TaxID=69181 RepID=A0ABQ7EJX6_BRACR|nr:hypothetical protein DY000_02024644 [Brassica cretica]